MDKNIYDPKRYLKTNLMFSGIFAIPFFVLSDYLLVKSQYFGVVITYVMSLALFVIFTAAFALIISRLPLFRIYDNKTIGRPIFFVVLMMFILLYADWYVRDYEEGDPFSDGFWWNTYPIYMVSVVLIMAFILIIYMLIRFPDSYMGRNGWGMWILYAAVATVYPLTVLTLNPFAADTYHFDAYAIPIYMVWFKVPYSDLSYGIYGHYELFYQPVLHLFGTSPFVITITAASLCAIVALIVFYILESLVSSRVIKAAAALGLLIPGGVWFRETRLQTTPHRFIFPLIVIALICRREKKNNKLSPVFFIAANAITAAAILWNLETGIICVVVLLFYFVLNVFSERENRKKRMLYPLLQILAAVLDLLAAVSAVNLYNLAVGGEPVFRSFFYPYINSGFMGNYYVESPVGNVTWVYLAVMSVATIILAVSGLFVAGVIQKGKCITSSCIAVTLLGSLTYYMSRAAYFNLMIVVPYALILLAFWADKIKAGNLLSGKLTIYEGIKQAVSVAAVYVLSGLAATCLLLPVYLMTNFEEGHYTLSVEGSGIEKVQEIEPGTYAIGWGTTEIFAYYGWDTGYHILGTSDVLLDPLANLDCYKELLMKIGGSDTLFLNEFAYEYLSPVTGSFNTEAKMEIFGEDYYYMVRR